MTATSRSPVRDRLIPFCALLVSIAALTLAVFEGYSNRVHHRLSVRPYLLVDFGVSDSEVGWLLGNEGLGPAIVAWALVTVDGRPCRSWSEMASVLQLPTVYRKYTNPIRGNIVRSGDRRDMFKVVTEDEPTREAVLRSRERVVIEVCYCSLYNECWKTRLARDLEAHRRADCSRPPSGYFGEPSSN